MSSRGAGLRSVNLAVYGTPEPPAGATPAAPGQSPGDTGLAKLNALVPAEAVALYIALISLIASAAAYDWKDAVGDPLDVTMPVSVANWTVLGIGILAAILATYLPVRGAIGQLSGRDKANATRNVIIRCFVMPVLFLALVIAAPGNFIFETFKLDPMLGFFAGAAVGLLAGAVQWLASYKKQ